MVMRQGQACTVVVSDMRTYVPNAVYLFACKGEIACGEVGQLLKSRGHCLFLPFSRARPGTQTSM